MTDTKTIARESFRLIETGDADWLNTSSPPTSSMKKPKMIPETLNANSTAPRAFSRPVAGYATPSRICVSNSRKRSRRETR
jgi:hypothetical protein